MITLAEIQATGLPLEAHDEIAAALSVDRVQLTATEIGNGTILAELGIDAGNQLLDAIYLTPAFKYVVPLLEQGRLDIGSPVTQAALDMLAVGGACTQADAEKLKALAVKPAPVTAHEVAITIERG